MGRRRQAFLDSSVLIHAFREVGPRTSASDKWDHDMASYLVEGLGDWTVLISTITAAEVLAGDTPRHALHGLVVVDFDRSCASHLARLDRIPKKGRKLDECGRPLKYWKMDTIILACAKEMESDDMVFISADRSQRAAAGLAGMRSVWGLDDAVKEVHGLQGHSFCDKRGPRPPEKSRRNT